MVIGATNHEDTLDPAAVRPGRFDKKIHVPLPDINGRTDIFELYLEKIARGPDVQARKLAEMCPGFTGAEIENLVNTAITEAIHRNKDHATMDDFEYARDRIMMGIERKKLSMSERDRIHTAIHEAGHAITCYFTPGAKKLYKATIVARGGSLGAVRIFLINKLAYRLTWFLMNQICSQPQKKKFLQILMSQWEVTSLKNSSLETVKSQQVVAQISREQRISHMKQLEDMACSERMLAT